MYMGDYSDLASNADDPKFKKMWDDENFEQVQEGQGLGGGGMGEGLGHFFCCLVLRKA